MLVAYILLHLYGYEIVNDRNLKEMYRILKEGMKGRKAKAPAVEEAAAAGTAKVVLREGRCGASFLPIIVLVLLV